MNENEMTSAAAQVETLTHREKDVLALLAQNLNDREIAASLVLSINSVKWYARRIYEKLGVSSRQRAVKKARELGLLEAMAPHEAPVHNLPKQLTRLVGRKAEIPDVVELVWKHALVTLTGSGGVGKTRLAVAAAFELLDDFQDGVRYVDLAPLVNPQMIPRTVMDAVGIQEETGRDPLESMIFYFSDRQMLLVLDNCEHLAEGCARLVHSLLSALSGLKVLATSREPLGVEGEVCYRVPSLACPEGSQAHLLEELLDYDAVQLFIDRAQAALPAFELNAQNGAAVAQICQRLDGIPLAIELAAARTGSLGIAQIAGRLDRSFRLLTGGGRTTLERHRTLRSAIEWSYQLISEAERILLRRLGIFVGGWTLEAAEKVCAGEGISEENVLDLLSQLVNKSLVLADHLKESETRYRLLTTLHQFALEELYRSGETEILRKRHFDWVAGLVAEAEPNLYTGKRLEWTQRLRADHNNLRAALEWALGEEADSRGGLEIFNALAWQYWSIYADNEEGIHWLEKGLAKIADETAAGVVLQVRTLYNMAPLPYSAKTYSIPYLEQALLLCERLGSEGRLERARVLVQLGNQIANVKGELQKGLEMVTTAETMLREMGPARHWDLAMALTSKTWILRFMGDEAAEQICAAESAALFLEVGDVWGQLYWFMAEAAQRRGDLDLAKRYCAEEIARCHEADTECGVAHINRMLANWERERGIYAEALPLYLAALKAYNAKAAILGICLALNGLASNLLGIAQAQSADEGRQTCLGAVRILAAFQAANAEYHLPTYFEDRLIFDQAMEIAKNRLAPDDFQTAWEEGRALRLTQATAFALSVSA